MKKFGYPMRNIFHIALILVAILLCTTINMKTSFAQVPPEPDRVITFDNVGGTEYGMGISATVGEVYVTGITTVGGKYNGYLLVYPASLDLEDPDWMAIWPGASTIGDYTYDIALSPNGIYLGGSGCTLASDGVGDFEGKLLLVKYSRSGVSGPALGGAVWNRSDNIFPYSGGEGLSAVVSIETVNGTVLYGAGTFETYGWGSNGAAVIGYSGEDGTRIFKEDNFFNSKYDLYKTSGASDLVSLGGNLYVAGHTHPNARIDGGNLANRRAALWKLDPSADPLITDPTLLFEISSSAFEAAVAGSEHVYAVGYSLDVSGKKDVLVAKFGTSGENVWTITWGEIEINEVAFGVALSNDRLYVVGETASSEGAGGKDMFLLEISATDGTILSRSLWGGPLDESGRDIAAEGSYLYVVGDTNTGGETVMDAFLLRYKLASTDVDGDGVVDELDNCPSIANPDQTNNDNDGQGDACDTDDDNDTFLDISDNCPFVSNADQADHDGDGIGDVCDADNDNDGVLNSNDNCPLTFNADQNDTDGDGIGDACDNDLDGDGVENALDNCLSAANPVQEDNDADSQGDACDTDDDNDGVMDEADNCPLLANVDQVDLDGDNIGDACDADIDEDGVDNTSDNCVFAPNLSQDDADEDGMGDACDTDDDDDGTADVLDNCQFIANADQADMDADGIGDACDADLDGDGVEDTADNCPMISNANQTDWNADGEGDACDADVDGDEVSNSTDICQFTAIGEVVDTATGCSISQLCPCDGPRGTTTEWKNHGQYVSCVAKSAENFVLLGLMTDTEKDAVVSEAASSLCGS